MYHFRDQILKGHPDCIVTIHADICCSFPLTQLLDCHQRHRGFCTMLATKVGSPSMEIYKDLRAVLTEL